MGVEESDPRARRLFGDLAVKEGLIQADTLKEAVREMDALSARDVQVDLGQILLRRGEILPDDFVRLRGEVDGRRRRCAICRTKFFISRGSEECPDCKVPLQPPDEKPNPVPSNLGKYEIRAELGRGGMGVVYLARDTTLNRDVAVKTLREQESIKQATLHRFVQEARNAAKLHHPNIITIHEAGEEGGFHFFVMDFIPGRTFDTWLAMGDPKPDEALVILEWSAEALHYAHEQGVIHRDVKPGNILINADGHPFVMDFGLSKSTDANSMVTRDGTILGTPYYMSPEHIRGETKKIDRRSDVYSLGVMLYEILTRRLPFRGSSVMEIYDKIINHRPRLPRERDRSIPADLEAICMKAMDKSPSARYATAQAFAEDLRRFRKGEPVHARKITMARKLVLRLRHHRKAVIAFASVAAAALIVLTIFYLVPSIRRASQDNERLERALLDKHEVEKGFRELMKAEEWERAVDYARRLFGTRVPMPELHDASRVSGRFAELRDPYEINLPLAFLRTGDPANAYRTGRDVPQYQGVAREAILKLSEDRLKEGAPDVADRAARLCAIHFGIDDSRTRAAMARVLLRKGKLEESAGLWHTLEEDPKYGAEAEENLTVLQSLLPRRRIILPAGIKRAVDLDGDGYDELLNVDENWMLHVFTPRGAHWKELGKLQIESDPGDAKPNLVRAVDLNNDGVKEIIAAGSGKENPTGKLVVVEWKNGFPEETDRTDLGQLCKDVQGVDIDGDGRTELMVMMSAYERSLRFYRFADGRLKVWFGWPVFCDPQAVRVTKDGIVLWIGAWQKALPGKVAYRIGESKAYRLSTEEYPWAFRVMMLRKGPEGLWTRVFQCADPISDGYAIFPKEDTMIVSSWASPEVLEVMPKAIRGVHRIRITGDGMSRAERIVPKASGRAYTTFARHLVVGSGNEMILVPDSGESRRIRVGEVGELQRMRTPDRVLLVNSRSDGIEVFGYGEYRPPPPPTIEWKEMEGEISPVTELLEAGLYEETVIACREMLRREDDPKVQYEMGVALSGLKRWSEAAEAFARAASADVKLIRKALPARAHALEQMRDWEAYRDCLIAITSVPGIGAFTREAAKRRLAWVFPLTKMTPSFGVRHWDRRIPFYCENAFKYRVVDDSLVLCSVSDTPGDMGGVLIRYRAGPLRMKVRFRILGLDWGSRIGFGIQSLSERNQLKPGVTPLLGVGLTATGASDTPVIEFEFASQSHDGRRSVRNVRRGDFSSWINRDLTLVMEYVEGRKVTHAEILDDKGQVLVGPVTLSMGFPLEAGLYSAGKLNWKLLLQDAGTRAGAIRVSDFSFESTAGLVDRASLDPVNAYQSMVVGNGRLVMGDYEAAHDRYREALEKAGTNAPLRAKILMHLALLHYRMGKPDEAGRAAGEAARTHAETSKKMMAAKAALGLTPEEIKFLLSSTR